MRDYSAIGTTLKKLRLEMKMSQKKLADEICTQAQISKIENGDILPLSSTLAELVSRLGVTLDYFFSLVNNPRFDYVEEFLYFVRKHIRDKDYQEVLWMIKQEKNNPILKSARNQQFLLWHEAISHFHIYKEEGFALSNLYKALDLTPTINGIYSERQVEILNSIAIIYDELDHYEKSAEIYRKTLKNLEQLQLFQDKNIKIRIYYNLSKTLTNLNQNQESILYAESAIKLCVEQDSLYLFGELHYQKGNNLLKLNQLEEGQKFISHARYIFELTKKEHLIKILDKEKVENCSRF
ncbi:MULTISPECIES: helix-turn-helix domain-containing protein [Paraliobacillus]|uniref:helix-turn-helix domain-containing protein n=1 Tax=Paraliobacillus TaxID=200903 RepID=UPI000DD2C311|nr:MULTISPECIES: helix-turn-helix domain-containing protein [Paraliobacillus]